MSRESASVASLNSSCSAETDTTDTRRARPRTPTMQERIDAQATEWLARQPQILNGLRDVREVERLALHKDLKALKAFISQRARDARDAQLTYWKKFFRLQRQSRGRPPEPEIETAASMRTHGLSYPDIAQRLDPRGYNRYPTETTNRIRKNVENYCRKAHIPLPHTKGKNSRP